MEQKEKKNLKLYSKDELVELKAIIKTPAGERSPLFEAHSKKWDRKLNTVKNAFYKAQRQKKQVKKVVKRNNKEKNKRITQGQKSWETRKRNQELGLKKNHQREKHNPPNPGKLLATRNQLRFPYKKIYIQDGEIVVDF